MLLNMLSIWSTGHGDKPPIAPGDPGFIERLLLVAFLVLFGGLVAGRR
jgi:hypothetical protein